jgi:hypothetical protein
MQVSASAAEWPQPTTSGPAPAARPGAARCRLAFWLRHESDVAGSNAAVVPPAAG